MVSIPFFGAWVFLLGENTTSQLAEFCFNPLLRGVGILTYGVNGIQGSGIGVSIPFFGAWVFLQSDYSNWKR